MKITPYFQALKKIKAVHTQISEEEKITDEKINLHSNQYYDLISKLKCKVRDLEYKRDSNKESLNTSLKNHIQKIRASNQSYYDTIKQAEKIFKLMGLFVNKINRDDSDYSRRSGYNNPCHVYADDLYKKISVHIAQTRKPKNKYSLVLSVQSVFKRPFEDLFHWSPDHILRDGATKESLLAWYEKNKNTILVPIKRTEHKPIAEFLKDHEALEKEYEQAKTLYETSKEWKLAYWKDQKEYYENQVSSGTSTEEYTGILETIKIIQAPDNLLATLLPKSDLAKEEFTKRCVGLFVDFRARRCKEN